MLFIQVFITEADRNRLIFLVGVWSFFSFGSFVDIKIEYNGQMFGLQSTSQNFREVDFCFAKTALTVSPFGLHHPRNTGQKP